MPASNEDPGVESFAGCHLQLERFQVVVPVVAVGIVLEGHLPIGQLLPTGGK
jgi:hypothetical protein